jgi:GTP cyclohydrolase I
MTIITSQNRLSDVQNQMDSREIALDRVGITGLHYPLRIRERSGGAQQVTARVDVLVGLHQEQRGAHLSSLIEVLGDYHERSLALENLPELARDVRASQDARGQAFDAAAVRIQFKYFIDKAAPVTGVVAPVAYDCGLEAELGSTESKSMTVGVSISSVCPCSLEISDVGAHNQRSNLTLQVWQPLADRQALWLEDLIELVEECGSAPIHTVLKRADEKAVTEQMFRSPRFVEDVVREVVVRLRQRVAGVSYRVWCESAESIHGHNAYAETSGACSIS